MKALHAACAAVFFLGVASVPASAQVLTVAYVASTGSGTGGPTECQRTNPCSSMTAALAATARNGLVVCLDQLYLSNFTVTKSVTIDCPLGTVSDYFTDDVSSITVSGTGISVTLRNLTIVASQYSRGAVGIDFVNGSSLSLENVKISGYSNGGYNSIGPGIGVRFAPISAGAKLFVSDSSITDNGFNGGGGGIVVNPASGGTAQVSLTRVNVSKNVFGVALDGSRSTGGINATISDSVLSGNTNDGLVVTSSSGGAPISALLTNVKSTNNGYGVRSISSKVTVRVNNSTIAGNGTGVSSLSGGALLSGGGNTIQANANNGGFTGSYSQQ